MSHPGIDKTFESVGDNYYGITKEEVQWIVGSCAICQQNSPQQAAAPLQPIVTSEIFEQVQIDLVTMRKYHVPRFQYILHIKDHFFRYSVLFPLGDKKSATVAGAMLRFFGFFGLPKRIHCDNGGEFQKEIQKLFDDKDIQVIQSRSYDPQAQGSVEKEKAEVSFEKLKNHPKTKKNQTTKGIQQNNITRQSKIKESRQRQG